MKQGNLIRSMSKKEYSPDNSACEGFLGRLKMNFFIVMIGNWSLLINSSLS